MRAGSKEMDERDKKKGEEGKGRKGKKGRNRWSPDSSFHQSITQTLSCHLNPSN